MPSRCTWTLVACALVRATAARGQPAPSTSSPTEEVPPAHARPAPAAPPPVPATSAAEAPAPAAASPPVAPAPPPSAKPPPIRLELHGFAGGSIYLQDAGLGPNHGGGAWYVTGEPARDAWSLGGDVRQTRLNVAAVGAPVMHGAIPRAVIEIDLFGGNGAGAFGDASVVPRLRQAYAELAWETTKVQVGQTHSLVLAMTPTTVGHVAFPLTYTAGTIGWRFPGIFVYRTVALPGPDTTAEIAVMIARAAWQNPSNAPFADSQPGSGDGKPYVSQDALGIGLGEASGLPQVEVRARFKRPHIEGFAAGHAHRVDRSGTGTSTGTQINLDVLAANAGCKLGLGPLTVQGSGYVGKNLAPLVGSLLQFQGPTSSDVREWGAWGQVGFAIDERLSVWALAATSRPRASDVRAAGLTRLRNTVASAMVRYQDGGYALGLELTRWATRKSAGADATSLSGDQIMSSASYTF